MINYKVACLLTVISLILVKPVLAGGGPVEFSVDTDQVLNPGEQYVVHARVYANGPYPTYCKNCFIRLGLQNPQTGDYVAQDSEVTNDDGQIYAKVISKVPGNRTLGVLELKDSSGNGVIANSTIVLKYSGEFVSTPVPTQQPVQPTSKPTVYPTPTATQEAVVFPTPASNPKVDELSKKVDDLQNQLDESKQKQNFLEARLSQITAWLKSIFPFFK